MNLFMRLKYSNRAILLSLCIGLASSVTADSGDKGAWYRDINWHGFASQGFAYTDRNNFLGSSSNGSFKFNEAGLNASWQGTLPVQVSSQVLYKQTGNAKHNGLSLDYAIIDWRALDTFDYSMGVRLGRLKNPYGFYNETRDVAATRPSILLPEGIYIDYLREVLHSSDSIGFYGDKNALGGTVSFSSIFGKPILNEHTVNAILSAKTGGELENEIIAALRVGYEDASGIWRAAISYARLDADFEAKAGSGFSSDDVTVKQFLFSTAFMWEQWELVGEFQRRKLVYNDIYQLIYPFDMDKPGESWYLQLGYHFTPAFSAFIRRDEVYLDRNDKHGTRFAAATAGAPLPALRFPARNGFAREMVMGFRYAPSFNWSFSAEFHKINGTLWLPSVENPDPSKIKRKWNLLLLQLAYRF